MDYYSNIFYECISECQPDDLACRGVCSRQYDENRSSCPCQSGCPNGCPCPNYHCPVESTTTGMTTTTTTSDLSRKSVLILNTYDSANKAIITDSNGKVEYGGDDFRFSFGKNTAVLYSCSITWHGELFIFGGLVLGEMRQISKLNGCSLDRVGSLPFDYYYGACGVIDDEDIYLCFDYYHTKTCKKASEPLGAFDETNTSINDHSNTRMGGSPGKKSYFSFELI